MKVNYPDMHFMKCLHILHIHTREWSVLFEWQNLPFPLQFGEPRSSQHHEHNQHQGSCSWNFHSHLTWSLHKLQSQRRWTVRFRDSEKEEAGPPSPRCRNLQKNLSQRWRQKLRHPLFSPCPFSTIHPDPHLMFKSSGHLITAESPLRLCAALAPVPSTSVILGPTESNSICHFLSLLCHFLLDLSPQLEGEHITDGDSIVGFLISLQGLLETHGKIWKLCPFRIRSKREGWRSEKRSSYGGGRMGSPSLLRSSWGCWVLENDFSLASVKYVTYGLWIWSSLGRDLSQIEEPSRNVVAHGVGGQRTLTGLKGSIFREPVKGRLDGQGEAWL